ncbi:MAG: zinc-dependent alcohol dehydrogenase family protein [Acidimicrobiia bacterium]
MRAALITAFGQPLEVIEVDDPEPSADGVVLRVLATGVCRSDWHAWIGHENLPALPHVPGHEMAGVIETVGAEVTRWKPGARVTVPFSVGCGMCASCAAGYLNTCDRPFTPGFTHWGSFAELVAIDHADVNLVALPAEVSSVDAAALGCRFITSFHAIVDQGRLQEGDWLAVHGCGGVGLSAIMIGHALGGRVIAVDIAPEKRALAEELGAEVAIDASEVGNVGRAIHEATGGAHVSIDALGSAPTASNSIRSLRKHGRHVQVGLMYEDASSIEIAMEPIIMKELEIIGSRGLPATEYPRVFELISQTGMDLGRLVTKTVALDQASAELEGMSSFAGVGVTVIDRF